MEIIILAGGFGSRLQSVVSDVPKCMAPVDGKPFLHYLFKYLVPFQPEKVILSLGYKHEVVEQWLKTIESPFEIVQKVEQSPLGTGGAIKYALAEVDGDSAVVINGDTYFDVDLNRFLHFHRMQGVETSLALKPMRNFNRYGSVLFDKDTNRIIRFEEKKYCSEGLINGGIYAIDKKVLDDFPEKFSMENDYFSRQVRKGGLAGFISQGYFIDIGIPEDYEKAQQVFA